MDDIAIKVENLTKVYKLYDKPVDRLKESIHPLRKKYHKDFYALKDVSFEVKKGETVGIIGKNGSGKSTLLKVLSGILMPSSGLFHVNGRISALLELGAGFNPEFSGIDNIYLNGTIMGYTKKEMDEKLESILSFADIGEFVYQPVKTYSSGMFVRLAFAVAVSVNPEIMIIDESLSVGDMSFQKKCMEKIDSFRESGKTILFCSHDMHAVSELCHHSLWIKDGGIEEAGPSNKVIAAYISWMTQSNNIKRDILPAKSLKNPHFYLRNSDEVEIISVNTFDSCNNLKNVFFTGDDIVIEVTYNAFKGITDPTYSLIILKHDGQPIALNKSNYNKEIISQGLVIGLKKINIILKNIQLNTESYIIGVSVWDKSAKLSFASNRTTEISIKSLKIAYGPLEQETLFFPETEWKLDIAMKKNIGTKLNSIRFWSELDCVIKDYSINKNDICLVGSIILSIMNIKEHNDIDIIIHPEIRKKMNLDSGPIKLSENVEIVSENWAQTLGIPDEILLNNEKYYTIYDGYKVVKLELLYSIKCIRKREKDVKDIALIESQRNHLDNWDNSLVLSNEKDTCIFLQSIDLLLSKQYQGNTFGRIDIIVKLMAIENYYKKCNYGIEIYKKMQKIRSEKWRKDIADEIFCNLIDNIAANGYDDESPIIVDNCMNLIDGSHRLAAALYFQLNNILVKFVGYGFKAPFDLKWFALNNFTEYEINAIETRRIELFKELGLFFHIILWPPIQDYFDEIENDIRSNLMLIDTLNFSFENNFETFINNIYQIDDIAKWKVEKKIKGMSSYAKRIRILCIEIPYPRYRKKESNNNDISTEVENIKAKYRSIYSQKIENYFHDIILHIGDNFYQNRKIYEIIKSLPLE